MNNLLLILFVIFTSTLASPGDTSVEIPSGFDASSLPADFNASSLPNGFNASSIPPDVVANATKAYIQNFVSGLGNATRSLLPGGDNGESTLEAHPFLLTCAIMVGMAPNVIK